MTGQQYNYRLNIHWLRLQPVKTITEINDFGRNLVTPHLSPVSWLQRIEAKKVHVDL